MITLSKNAKELVKQTVTDIQNAIQAQSKVATQKSIEKYMKYIQKYRGMSTTDLRNNIFKSMWTTKLKELDTDHRKEIAHSLLAEEFGEDKTFGLLIFGQLKNEEIDLNDVKRVEELFTNGTLKGWASTDSVSGTIFRPWVLGSVENTKYISNWMNSDCIWLQRASCVTFVTLAKKGNKEPNFDGFIDTLLQTCEKTIQNQERFVQLGTGWLLREIGVHNKSILKDFINKNLEYFTKEGLSYAIEKLPANDQTKFKNMLKSKKAVASEDEVEIVKEEIKPKGQKKRKVN